MSLFQFEWAWQVSTVILFNHKNNILTFFQRNIPFKNVLLFWVGEKAASYVTLHHSTLTSEPKEYVFFNIVGSIKCYVCEASDSKDECQNINFPYAFFSVFMLYQ